MIKYLAGILFVFGFGFVHAQTDTSILLQAIEIQDQLSSSDKFSNAPQDLLEESMGVDQLKSLAELISNGSGVYVKSYGPSSISSISSRGSGASQNLVLWNDIPLNNPMIGQLDFGLLSGFLFDKISLNKNPSSANWGSGAIGAVINLTDQIHWNKGLNYVLQSSMASFQNVQSGGQIAYSKKGWNIALEGTYLKAKNNFPYYVSNHMEPKLLNNAIVKQHNIKPSLHFKWNNKHISSFHSWFQTSERQIPPTTTQNYSFAFQNDASNKFLVEHNMLFNRTQVQMKAYYSDEKLRFVDSLNQVDDTSYFNRYVTQIEYIKEFNKGTNFRIGNQIIRNKAFHPSYKQQRFSTEISTYINFLQTIRSWKFGLHGRVSKFSKSNTQFIPSGTIEKIWGTHLKSSIKINRNYRLPTLNEFYWIPGGNVDLKPEFGWSQEFVNIYNPIKKNRNIIISLGLFNRLINDWILWSQKEGEFFYAPQNIASVWSRGIDSKFDIKITKGNHTFLFSNTYQFVLSTNQKALSNPTIKKGSQLFYTPKHQAYTSLKWSFRRWVIKLNHQYIGSVTGINEDISAYIIGDIDIENSIKIKQNNFIIFGSIKNFTNQNYRVVERRPMPGRNFTAGLIFTNKSNKNE